MALHFYNCGGCGDIESDCAPLISCAYCESYIFECCQDEMVKKFGRVDPDSEDAKRYGKDAVKRCNECCDCE